MRIACLLLPHLRADLALRRRPELQGRPVVIIDRSAKSPVVLDSSPAAARVRPGMSLEQALSMHADPVLLKADERACEMAFNQVLAALRQVSDLVEGAQPGRAWLRLDGLAAAHGGEARFLERALPACVPDWLRARIGAANAKFPALVAARLAGDGDALSVPADARAFLAPHSIDHLPLAAETRTALHRFGLHTMGAVAALQKRHLVDQFGPAGARARELCRGIDDRPLAPAACAETVVERAILPGGADSLQHLLASLETLVARAWSRPRMQGRQADRAELECLPGDAPAWRRTVHFRPGAASAARAAFVMRSRLELDHPQAAIEEMTLTLGGLRDVTGVQGALLPDLRRERHQRLVEALRGLQARGGAQDLLFQVRNVAPWHPVPEMRALQVPVSSPGAGEIRPLSRPTPVEVREGPDRRPLALRRGRRWRRVERIEERWCFDLWWLPQPLTRSCYRVCDEDGGTLTLFRDERDRCWYRQGPGAGAPA